MSPFTGVFPPRIVRFYLYHPFTPLIAMKELLVHPELQSFQPASPNRPTVEMLEDAILKHGSLAPILTWKDYIVDGHRCYPIYKKYQIPFKVFECDFKSVGDAKLWLYDNLFDETQRSQCVRPNPSERSEHPVPETFFRFCRNKHCSTRRMIPLNRIRIDCGTQSRIKIDQEMITTYAEAMKRGEKFQPILVFQETSESDYILVDGFHRYYAHQKIQPEMLIAAEVKAGNISDARWASFEANATHGMPRSNDDKHRAVELAILHQHGQNLSNYLIAEHVKVSESTVRRIRSKMQLTTSETQSEKRTGRDGRIIKTAKIGKANKNQLKNDTKSQPVSAGKDSTATDKKTQSVKPENSNNSESKQITETVHHDFFTPFINGIPSDLVREIVKSSLPDSFVDNLPVSFLNVLKELPKKNRYERLLKNLSNDIFCRMSKEDQTSLISQWFDQQLTENESTARVVLDYLEMKLNQRCQKKLSKKKILKFATFFELFKLDKIINTSVVLN
jgi:transposase